MEARLAAKTAATNQPSASRSVEEGSSLCQVPTPPTSSDGQQPLSPRPVTPTNPQQDDISRTPTTAAFLASPFHMPTQSSMATPSHSFYLVASQTGSYTPTPPAVAGRFRCLVQHNTSPMVSKDESRVQLSPTPQHQHAKTRKYPRVADESKVESFTPHPTPVKKGTTLTVKVKGKQCVVDEPEDGGHGRLEAPSGRRGKKCAMGDLEDDEHSEASGSRDNLRKPSKCRRT